MKKRTSFSVLISLLFFHFSIFNTLSAAETKKSRIFGGIAILSSLAAVYCDAKVEENYRRYRDATDSPDCVKYRKRTQNYEKVRDGFIILSFSSVITSLIFSKIEEKGVKIEIEGNEKEMRLNLKKNF